MICSRSNHRLACGCMSSLTNEHNPLMQHTWLIFHEKLMCSVPSGSLFFFIFSQIVPAEARNRGGKKNNSLVNNKSNSWCFFVFFFRFTERWVFGQKQSTKMKKVPVLRRESCLVHTLGWLISNQIKIGVFSKQPDRLKEAACSGSPTGALGQGPPPTGFVRCSSKCSVISGQHELELAGHQQNRGSIL